MLGRVFSVLTCFSFVFALFTGRMPEVCDAAISGAQEAVNLCFSMTGMLCLWNGVIRVLDKAGATEVICRIISPLLKIVYPEAYKKGSGIKEISSNFAANLLGLGNAALPLGLSAMSALCDGTDRASDEMVTFSVLNTVPFQLIPATLIAMRAANGSARPYEIILPVWICSCITIIFAVILCKGASKLSHIGEKRE